MRVAYVMSRFPKLTETFILAEMVEMAASGVDVEVFPLRRERATRVQAAAAPFVDRAHYLPFLSPGIVVAQLTTLARHPGRYLGALAGVVRGTWRSPRFLLAGLAIFPKVVAMSGRMRAAGVDHVHCHFASHPALAGWIIRRLTGMPYSFTAHGSDLHRDRTMLCDKIAAAAFAVTISQYNRDLMLDTCPAADPGSVEVIHCGVDTGRFVRAEAEPPMPLAITAIGTLHEVKGQAYLVEAVRLLRDRGVDVRCRFVGDGEDRPRLEAQVAEARLGDRVRFEGLLTSDEILGILHESHLLAAPSVPTRSGRREGIPVVLMEAMACGLPVVASRLSGIPELVEDGTSGLLVPPRDPVALADAIERLADDGDLRRRLGAAARATVLAEFDAALNARQLRARIEAVAA